MGKKFKTFLTAFVCLLLSFVFALGCADTKKPENPDNGNNGGEIITPDGDGDQDSDGDGDDGDDQQVLGSVEYPKQSPWTSAPTVKGTFFSDFGKDRRIGEDWSLVNYGWGQNGVSKDNAGYTQSTGMLQKMGATGGVVILNSYGHYYSDKSKRGQGSVLISNRMFGPGRYEVRMKIVPRFGPCSTAWSYYTNSKQGLNTADNIQYHEIDIECPQIGKGFNGWGGVAYEKYYQDSENDGKTVNESQGVNADVDNPFNDGQWHVFAFDWRTTAYDYDADAGENAGAVIWYMDGKEVARTAKHTPYYPDQLWIGNWFPDNSEDWLGVADFEQAYMYVDWVRITEYDDEYLTVGKDGKEIKPELGGCVTFSTAGGNTNYGTKVPVNNYISNGTFVQGDGKEDGESALGWTVENAVWQNGKLSLSANSKAVQEISAQYGGYEFDLSVSASATQGKVKVYAEYIKGDYNGRTNSNKKMTRTVVGKSEEIVFENGGAATKTLTFTVPKDKDVNNLRIVIESADGTVAEITEVKMYLKSDTALIR